ncbi:MAG: DNA topoisomerase [Acidimicrobiales bacterium]|nr:MAG: DNA topoisomerase [Acidimicrobiales bacterium]
MRLRRSALFSPGIVRIRRGRGFQYLSEVGSPLNDPEILDRVRSLAIPPAWRRVWICPYPNGHIQAVGIDAAGRRQYLYHAQWRRARDEEKHDRVLVLAKQLPAFRAQIYADLNEHGLSRRRVLAAALRILDSGVFRVGGEEYAEENGSRGVATLLREHVRISGDVIKFHFPAKSGVDRVAEICDADLAKVLGSLKRCRADTDRLFACDDMKSWHELRAEDVNERFKELVGEEFTVKDLRTWKATVFAAEILAETEPVSSQRARKRLEAQVMRQVSDELGNTPAIVKKSYVDPRVMQAFDAGITIRSALRRARAQEPECARVTVERAVVKMLSAKGK